MAERLTGYASRLSNAWRVLRGQGVEPPRPGRTDAIQTQLGPPAPAYGPPTSPTPNYVPPLGTGDGPAFAPPTPALGQRSFGPLTPLEPRYSPESAEGQAPRRFQYPVGVNILVQPRQDFPGLTPFDQLRNLSDIYDVSAMCIAARIEQTQGMGYSCVANDKRKQRQFKDECETVEKFMDRPDGITPFLTWLGIAIREHLVTDALTIFPRKNYGGGLARLNLIDGSLIKPILDDEGNTRGYQQILYGYPFSDYHQPMDAAEAEQAFPIYSPNELLYLPRFASINTPYGKPPTEFIILRVNQALRKQLWDLNYFTEGNIPEMLATMPEGTMTAEQVDEFEKWFNSVLAGNDKERRRMRFIPWQAQVQELRPFTYETTLDEWMMRITCAAYAVPPQELGFTNDVNRATAELQEAVNERRGLKPLSTWFKRAVFDPIIHTMFDPNFKPGRALSVPGQPTHTVTSPFREIGWSWSFGDKSDLAVQAQTDSTYIEKFVLSKDEVRALRFSDLVEGPAPLTDEEKAALKEAQAAGTAPPTPPEGGELSAPPTGGAAPGGAPEGGAPTPGVEAAPAGGGPAPAGPTGVAGATAPPAPAGEAVTAAITAEWRKIEDTLYIRDGVKRDQTQRAIYDRVRQALDKWAYNLSRAATIGNNPYSLYREMEDEIRNAIRRELVNYQEQENRDMNFSLMARANAGDLRDEFVDDLFESLLPVCIKTPPGGYVFREQVHYVLSSLLPDMATKVATRFPAKLNTDLVKMSKAEVSNYQTSFGAWLADSINWTSAWAMEVSAGTDPLELALTLAHLEATRIFSAPLAHAITLLNRSTLRKATPGLKPLGGPGIIPPASESRGDVGPTPAAPAPKAKPAEEQGGLVIAPPMHLHCRCLPGGSEVLVPGEALAATKAFYVGRCVEITLANGKQLTVTANHPILTRSGWIAAGLLRKGDEIFRTRDSQRIAAAVDPNNDHMIAPIEQVFETLAHRPGSLITHRPVSRVDLYGDGGSIEGEIEVVLSERLLRNNLQTLFGQPIEQGGFLGSDVNFQRLLFRPSASFHAVESGVTPASNFDSLLPEYPQQSRARSLDLAGKFGGWLSPDVALNQLGKSARGNVGAFSPAEIRENLFSLSGRQAFPLVSRDIPSTPNLDSAFFEVGDKGGATNAYLARQFVSRFSGEITLDEVIKVRDFNFAGHVYDLQVDPYSLFFHNTAILTNCKIRARKVGEVWLALWWTDHNDACTDDLEVPWGTVAGCLDMKNRCITSGSKLGQRFAESGGDITGQQAEAEVGDEGEPESEGAYFAAPASMRKSR